METNGKFKVMDHKSCNGKAKTRVDTPKCAHRTPGVSRKILWGISMVMVALFRFLMTWAIGMTAEPVNVTLTSILGVLGMSLLAWSWLSDRTRNRTPDNPRHL